MLLVKPTISRLLEVDIGVSEGPAGDHVPAHSDGENGPSRTELLVKHGLGNVWMQVPHIQGGHRVTRRARIHVGVLLRQRDNAVNRMG